jgi:lipopolysaccharide export LptBFGC system permease protein LptF
LSRGLFFDDLAVGFATLRAAQDVKNAFPNRTALILAAIAFVLVAAAIVINYFRGGEVQFVHLVFALGLLAFVVWFSGRDGEEAD